MVSTGLSRLHIFGDIVHFLGLCLRPKTSLAAENFFLRTQLIFYQERKIKPRRADNPTRLTPVLLSRWFNWRDASTVVRPKTFVALHRKGFRLLWRSKFRSWPAADSRRTSTSDFGKWRVTTRLGARNGSQMNCC